MEKYLDASLPAGERARDLIGRMSLDEKMGQIVCYNPSAWSHDDLERDYPHGAGEIAFLIATEMRTLEEAFETLRSLQTRVMALSEHHIPAIFHMETLCGAMLPEADGFPSGIGQGATWDAELQKMMATVIGKQARAVGVTHAFAPVLDISRDSRFGRQGETYGEDPALASAMGVAYVRGLQQDGDLKHAPMACAKHFLGYHCTQGGIHAANCYVPARALREIYAKPFQAAVTLGGLRSVMNCYSSINGEPVASSRELLGRLLRGEMGFDGLVVSDYVSVSEQHTRQKAYRTKTEAGIRSLGAGMDVELPSKDCYGREMRDRFASGELDAALLDTAVLRVLTAKFALGLFENPCPESFPEARRCFGGAEAQSVAARMAQESLVLLKNDGTLPLRPGLRRIAVIGCHAESPRALFGGYSFISMTENQTGVGNTMAGVDAESVDRRRPVYPGSRVEIESPRVDAIVRSFSPHSRSLLEALREELHGVQVDAAYGYPYAGDDETLFEEALRVAGEADLVILTLGGKYGWGTGCTTGEGIDATNINLPPCQECFIRRAARLGIPLVGVHFDGRPLSSDAADECLNAIIEAWSPGEMGAQAIVGTLLGRYNPAGRLPVSVARNAGQIPVYYNHENGASYDVGTISAFTSYVDAPHEPRYFFGYGLSYTTFRYGGLSLNREEFSPKDTIRLTVRVANTGERDGEEVVQLYQSREYASMVRPVRELLGFRRVYLRKSEEKTVTFEVDVSQFAFLDADMRWVVEAGEVTLLVGGSSEDVRLRCAIRIAGSAEIDGKTRGFYARVTEGAAGPAR